MILDLLYHIIIYPLEIAMQGVLNYSFILTGNYGISIIILSIIVNIVLLPIYYIAEDWKKNGKIIQDKMAPEIEAIKKYYKGQERHYYIQTIYRRYNYHPLSSVKSSIGFLIQIPFFFAAFHLLSNFQPLNGVEFFIIDDLGKADGIIFGINLLPILMTVINILSSYIYIKDLSKSERNQILGLAFLFLILLYNEPAGLLLYWTLNNLFSLLKNFTEKELLKNFNANIIYNYDISIFNWFFKNKENIDKLLKDNKRIARAANRRVTIVIGRSY